MGRDCAIPIPAPGRRLARRERFVNATRLEVTFPLLPESARIQLRFQHEVLRALLARLASASERVLRGEPAVQDLRDAQRTLHAVLEMHLRQEEATLASLPGAPADPRLLERVRAQHGLALNALVRQRGRPPRGSAAASARLVPRMLAAMDLEEEQLLGGTTAPAPWSAVSHGEGGVP